MRVVDLDRDGFCEMGADLNDDLDCADEGEPGDTVDAFPLDPTVYPGAPENCVDAKDNDQNGVIDWRFTREA